MPRKPSPLEAFRRELNRNGLGRTWWAIPLAVMVICAVVLTFKQ
jgi:hypothetical protein